MPLFGNRMVVATANYKHIEEKKKEFFERETRLGRWVSERKARKEKLQALQVRIGVVKVRSKLEKKIERKSLSGLPVLCTLLLSLHFR